MTITNLLPADYLKIQVTTNKRLKGKYTLKGSLKYSTATNTYFGDITGLANPYFGFKILSTSAPSGLDGLQDNFELKYDDGTGTYFDAEYYEIVLDLTVEYLYPPLDITVPDPQIYDYDGTEKSVQYIVNSTTGTGFPVSPTGEYWLLSSPDKTYASLSFIEVGEYEVGFKFSAPNFEDYIGSTKIIIKQAVLSVTVDPLTKVYDLQPLEATWSINPAITIIIITT